MYICRNEISAYPNNFHSYFRLKLSPTTNVRYSESVWTNVYVNLSPMRKTYTHNPELCRYVFRHVFPLMKNEQHSEFGYFTDFTEIGCVFCSTRDTEIHDN